MEIEARYVVPDRLTFRALRRLTQVGAYAMSAGSRQQVTDRYLDTDRRGLFAAGWACRLRTTEGRWWAVLKSPAKGSGPISSRLEWEVPLEMPTHDPAEWPSDEVRDLVHQLIGDEPLVETVVLQQVRYPLAVSEGSRPVATLTLDRVQVRARGLKHRSHILECELLEEGTREDLKRLGDALVGRYHLLAEPRSKLQRALALLALTEARPSEGPPRLSPAELIERYELHGPTAHYTGHLAEVLYNDLQSLHGLAPWHRALTRTAAELHAIGEALGSDRPGPAGRDLLLAQPLEGIADEDRAMVAAAAYLFRGPVGAKAIERALPKKMDPERRREGLIGAAIVRMVAALTRGPLERTRIERVTGADRGEITVHLVGTRAKRDAARAAKRSDLWEALVGHSVRWEGADLPPEKRMGLTRSDTVRQAAVKILGAHFRRMVDRELGTRDGSDPEDLHDMRVATRRLRAALRLFGPYLAGTRVTPLLEGLRQTGRTLGAVRDLDVQIENARAYLDSLPEDGRPDLTALLEYWQARRDQARRTMIEFLDSPTYQDLVTCFGETLQEQASDLIEPEPAPARDTGSRYIHVYWRGVLGYRRVIEGAPVPLLHALRIDTKRLRYTLEAFQELLGPASERLIAETVAMQDHLGAMRDAQETLDAIDEYSRAMNHAAAMAPGVAAYRDHCRDQIRRRLQSLPKAWKRLSSPEVRKAFRQLRPK